jgi:hypothetical protein
VPLARRGSLPSHPQAPSVPLQCWRQTAASRDFSPGERCHCTLGNTVHGKMCKMCKMCPHVAPRLRLQRRRHCCHRRPKSQHLRAHHPERPCECKRYPPPLPALNMRDLAISTHQSASSVRRTVVASLRDSPPLKSVSGPLAGSVQVHTRYTDALGSSRLSGDRPHTASECSCPDLRATAAPRPRRSQQKPRE